MEKKTKYVLLGLGVVGFGIGGYYIYKHFAGGKTGNNNEDLQKIINASQTPSKIDPFRNVTTTKSSSNNQLSSGFPLQRGSKGDLVKNLQEALIQQYGTKILPKYGADGGFGTETQKALLSKGLPISIDSDTYTKILLGSGSNSRGSSSSTSSTNEIAITVYKAIIKDNFSEAMRGLKKIKNVNQYKEVNTHFKEKRLGLVRMTLVTGLLSRFNSTTEKKQINQELYRIGLKYDGSKWSLEGISGINTDKLITIETTKIWDKDGTAMMIPKGTIIGEYLDANNGVTQIETLDGKRLFIKTTTISYQS